MKIDNGARVSFAQALSSLEDDNGDPIKFELKNEKEVEQGAQPAYMYEVENKNKKNTKLLYTIQFPYVLVNKTVVPSEVGPQPNNSLDVKQQQEFITEGKPLSEVKKSGKRGAADEDEDKEPATKGPGRPSSR